MSTTGWRVGRPRAEQRAEAGLSALEQLLAAAAELFTTRGYAATTVRAVAERAGLRQAAVYQCADGKEELLADLLESAVRPSLKVARAMLADEFGMPAELRLWILCRSEVELACRGPHHLGGLFLLPEVRTERFAGFRRMRARLRDAYGELLSATAVGRGLDAAERAVRTDLVLGLIEGVTLTQRSDPGRPAAEFATSAADAALRVAGVDGSSVPRQ